MKAFDDPNNSKFKSKSDNAHIIDFVVRDRNNNEKAKLYHVNDMFKKHK